NLRTKIAEAGPIQPLVQVHFGNGHAAPVRSLRKHPAFAVVNSGNHPVARGVGVSAADEEDMVLAGSRRGEHRVATPNWKSDDFRTVNAELPCRLGEKPVVAHHHAQLAEARLEYRIFFAGRDATFDFRARQSGLAIFALDFSVRSEEHGDVVDQMPLAFHQADNEV